MHRNNRVPSIARQQRPGQLFVEPRGNAYSEAAELENLTFYTGSGTRGQVFGLLACFSSFACLFCLETFTTMASQRRPSNSSVLVTCLKTKWRVFVPFCHHSSFLSKAPAWRGRHDCATGCNYRSQKLGRMIHLTVVKVMISIWFEATIQIRQRDCHFIYPVHPPQPQTTFNSKVLFAGKLF